VQEFGLVLISEFNNFAKLIPANIFSDFAWNPSDVQLIVA